MHLILVNRLRGLSLPRNSVVRLSDRPDMAMDVKQQNNNHKQCSIAQLSDGKLHVNVDALANLKTTFCPQCYFSGSVPNGWLAKKF